MAGVPAMAHELCREVSAVGLQWDCSAIAMGLRWGCDGARALSRGECSGIVSGGECSGMQHDCYGMQRDCYGIAVGLLWDCNVVIMVGTMCNWIPLLPGVPRLRPVRVRLTALA